VASLFGEKRLSLALHLADLDDRLQIGVIRDIPHDGLVMRTEGGLESLDRIEIEVTHSDVSRRRSRCRSAESLIDVGTLARRAKRRLHHRHMFIAVVVDIEPAARFVEVEHAHLDHVSILPLVPREFPVLWKSRWSPG